MQSSSMPFSFVVNIYNISLFLITETIIHFVRPVDNVDEKLIISAVVNNYIMLKVYQKLRIHEHILESRSIFLHTIKPF